jgi:hemoglobin
MEHQPTMYEQVGGEATFRRLVDIFYARVEHDPLLRPLFPADMEPGKQYQLLFLMQYFGGPTTYSERRGHPRLRMRHAPFAIGQRERDAWLGHMLAALDEVGIGEPAYSAMRSYFERAATAMVNRVQPA